jgi:hypothetical protein
MNDNKQKNLLVPFIANPNNLNAYFFIFSLKFDWKNDKQVQPN